MRHIYRKISAGGRLLPTNRNFGEKESSNENKFGWARNKSIVNYLSNSFGNAFSPSPLLGLCSICLCLHETVLMMGTTALPTATNIFLYMYKTNFRWKTCKMHFRTHKTATLNWALSGSFHRVFSQFLRHGKFDWWPPPPLRLINLPLRLTAFMYVCVSNFLIYL